MTLDEMAPEKAAADTPNREPRVIYINEHKDGKLFNFYLTDERTAEAVCERGIVTRKFVEEL